MRKVDGWQTLAVTLLEIAPRNSNHITDCTIEASGQRV
jgi:hypothetical protein